MSAAETGETYAQGAEIATSPATMNAALSPGVETPALMSPVAANAPHSATPMVRPS